MKKLRNRIYLAVVILAMIAMAMPMIGKGVRAYSNSASGRAISGNVKEANALASAAAPAGPVLPAENGNPVAAAASQSSGEGQRLSREMLEKMGIPLLKGNNKTAQSIAIGQAMARRMIGKGQAVKPQSAEPTNMLASAALSTALITNVGGRSTQFDEVLTLADWNGQEQFSANHSGKVDDFSGKIPTGPTGPSEFQLTRAAISEHTIANGFPEDIFYYGDSFGNVYVNATTSLTLATPAPNVFTINLPTVLNAFGSLNSDDQVVVTGLAVSPVVDLTSFSNVNGSFASFAGLIGEVLYVTFTDTESGFRLISNGTLVRSGVLAFPVADILSAAPAPPGIVSPTGFPVQVGGAFGVAFSVFDNEAGCAVDDDGSLYFQQVDLITLGGGNIVKITSTDNSNISTGFQDRSLATDGFITLTSLHQLDPPPAGGGPAITTGPAKQVNTFTDYSGVANLFGNIEALATGPCNNVYAAVARSGEPTDPVSLQIAEGPYSTGGTALGATPTMVIRFSDVIGAFAPCTLPTLGGPEPESDRGRRGAKVKKGVKPSGDATPSPSTTTVPIVPNGATGLPIGDGVADPVPPAGGGAIPSVIPGVNNFIIFVEGDGPDIRVATGGTSPVNATKSNTLQINDGVGFQVDPTIYAGITVDREGTVYVVSGGTPEGVGNNPSPTFGEILAFPDNCPQDGRADFIDFRGATTLPNPPSAGTNTGDGLSTRTDHIFWIAPLDVVNGENDPTAIAGLNIGFELYLNRTRTADNTTELPNGATQTDDGSNGPVIFEQFDPSHQVAGGDDQTFPFTGDDDDGAGSPVTPGPLSGGFEFLFANLLGDFTQVGAACGTGNGVWNGFFANANGNITFGIADSSFIASETVFRAGPPKIAAAWCDLDPESRAEGFLNTFPVQAFGFAGINDFEIRNINIPETGFEFCGSRNTFSTFLFDDGTGVDENANQPLNPANPIGNNEVPFNLLEGPTANRFVTEPVTGVIVGCPPRQDGTGHFCFLYGRMDLLGLPSDPVIVGFSVGNQNPINPPGLCSIDLGSAAVAADADTFRPCLIGEGTEPTIFELFDTGVGPTVSSGGNPVFATPDFDLRCEGNGGALAAAVETRQVDQNRGRVCFFGTTCQLPPNPTCFEVVPTSPVPVPPGDPAVGSAAAASDALDGHPLPTSGIINALCNVQLNVVGCGIIPNETTIICSTPETGTGEPETRPGKTVSSIMVLGCDSNGDGVPDTFIQLTAVTPVNGNLVQGTLSTTVSGLAGTAFPLTCCGGPATLTTTTTFSAGNNNIFNLLATGGFTRSMTCSIDLGNRAPVVISASPSVVDCSIGEDIVIPGSCFILPDGTINVTSVFAVDQATGAVIEATSFTILSPTEIDAFFNFGSANAGHTFLIFVSGPNGTSRNLTSPSGSCPAGNEVGVIVTVGCKSAQVTPTPCPTPPSVVSCKLNRSSAGKEILTVVGSNILSGATVTVGGVTPAHINLNTGTQTFTLKGGGLCKGLPGNIIITNPAQSGEPSTCSNASTPFLCNETCPK